LYPYEGYIRTHETLIFFEKRISLFCIYESFTIQRLKCFCCKVHSTHSMNNWDAQSIGLIIGLVTLIFTGISLAKDIYEIYSKRSRLVFKVEKASLIEDSPGEIGLQINISLRAYNSSFFLKEFYLENSDKLAQEKVEQIEYEIRQYISEDITEKYLEVEKLHKRGVVEREKEKQDQFNYFSDLKSGSSDFRKDLMGNAVPPITESYFQRSLNDLLRKHSIGDIYYKNISTIIASIRDVKVSDDTSQSYTLFIHIYGCLNESLSKREALPLDGWNIVLHHSEGKLKRSMEIKKIPYSQVKSFLDPNKY